MTEPLLTEYDATSELWSKGGCRQPICSKELSQSEVAQRVGAHRQSVSQWAETLREQGRTGLRKAGRAGRPAGLRPEDLKRIEGH